MRVDQLRLVGSPQTNKVMAAETIRVAVRALGRRALFDLAESHSLLESSGLEAYRAYQMANENDLLEPGIAFRLGGLVQQKSVRHGSGADVRFTLTDGKGIVPVEYNGVLPALFREGQGVVANGKLDATGIFHARELLAKHDEKYMPPEVAEALKRSGRWNESEGKPR